MLENVRTLLRKKIMSEPEDKEGPLNAELAAATDELVDYFVNVANSLERIANHFENRGA
jgi:hypothetical protein